MTNRNERERAMAMFGDFAAALAEWHESGGAMNYHCGDVNGPAAWEVASACELAERMEWTPWEATMSALRQGGLTESEIAAEMADWAD